MDANTQGTLLDILPSPVAADDIRRLRKPSPKQAAIIAYLRINGTITTAQATELVGRNVYYNQSKHTGAVLSNMVSQGLIKRIKTGVFTL